MTVEQIIERYNEESEREREHQLSDESPIAEFVESFFYGEMSVKELIDGARLDEVTKSALRRVKKSEIFDLLREHSELVQTGIYVQDGEIASAHIGEIECQPSDELLEAYLSLSAEDQEKVRRSADVYISDSTCKGWMYINCEFSRHVLVCDEDSLKEALGVDSLETEGA